VLLIAGDLTRHGMPSEASVLAAEVATAPVPVVVVLGTTTTRATPLTTCAR
jgi:hypothetical protein